MTESDARLQAQTLRRAAGRFQRALRSTRNPESPTPSQLSALGTLHREGPLAVGELARRERLKPQSVTRLIAALVARGFVERLVDESDRRRFVANISAEGRRALTRDMRQRDLHLARLLEKLSDSERATLADACPLLERLANAAAQPT